MTSYIKIWFPGDDQNSIVPGEYEEQLNEAIANKGWITFEMNGNKKSINTNYITYISWGPIKNLKE